MVFLIPPLAPSLGKRMLSSARNSSHVTSSLQTEIERSGVVESLLGMAQNGERQHRRRNALRAF
jgi:hypothetical protein